MKINYNNKTLKIDVELYLTGTTGIIAYDEDGEVYGQLTTNTVVPMLEEWITVDTNNYPSVYEYKVLNQIVHGNYKDVRSGYYNEVMALEVEDIRKIIEFKEDTFAGRYYVIFRKYNNPPLVIKNRVNDVNTKHMMAPFIRRHKEAVIELSYQDVY